MDPITIAQLIPAAIGAGQTISGLLSPKKQYPTLDLQTPESTLKALSNAEYVASQTQLPGYETIKSNIGESTAGAIDAMSRVADSPAAILQGIQRLTGSENERLQELGIAGAENFQQNQGILRNQLNTVGSMERDAALREFQQNELDRYVMENQKKQALIGSGMQNLTGAVQNYAGTSLWKNLYEQSINDNSNYRDKLLKLLEPTLQPSNTSQSSNFKGSSVKVDYPNQYGTVTDKQQVDFTPSSNYFDLFSYLAK